MSEVHYKYKPVANFIYHDDISVQVTAVWAIEKGLGFEYLLWPILNWNYIQYVSPSIKIQHCCPKIAQFYACVSGSSSVSKNMRGLFPRLACWIRQGSMQNITRSDAFMHVVGRRLLKQGKITVILLSRNLHLIVWVRMIDHCNSLTQTLH